jgi:hypothetical protein
LVLTLSDEIELIGDRFYVKATATITDGREQMETTAFAREALAQKGMSEAQCSGSSSSYARKYALNGLFAIDDTADDDTRPATDPNSPLDVRMAERVYNLLELADADLKRFLEWAGVEHVKDIRVDNYQHIISTLETKVKSNGQA